MNSGENSVEARISSFESLADWCAWLIVVGLVLEVALAAGASDSAVVNKWGLVGSDALVALGVAGEILFSRKARSLADSLQRESNEKIAEANRLAEEAHERTADIERITAFRRISHEQLEKIREALRGLTGQIDLLIEHQYGDTEAFVYARDLAATFWNVAKVRSIPNSFVGMTAFGLFVAASPSMDIEVIAQALTDAGIAFSRMHNDLSTHLPRNEPVPNLYIFVAPKPPPPLISPAVAPRP
jgi:hypothetical protein